MTFLQRFKALEGKTQAATATEAGIVKQAANVPASTATTVANAKDDINAILTALKAAGIMAADAS